MKFKVGDKVVRTAECSDYYTVKQGCEYVISKVDDEYNNIYLQGVYDNNGQPDWFNHDNFELVDIVNDLAKAQNPVDCSHYQKDLFSKYFKDEVKESKKLKIKAQIESLQEQLKQLD